MSDQALQLLVGPLLLVHGMGHGGAFGALILIRARPGTNTGDWAAARTWLIPDLPDETATTLAAAFWLTALAGFVLAALSFWGIVLPVDVWRFLAVGSAVISFAGIVLFLGTWPVFNTVAALAVDVVILVAVCLRWPSPSIFS